ncbi:MAG TPA: SDR family NAD(P)-dependent oxidoreductase [Solirubrobacteraceae bacterium]|jgi:short-subunit dehydrogenase
MRIGSQLVLISGSRVLLTGASGGLGGAIAKTVAGRGATLVLSGRNADLLSPIATEIGAEIQVADLVEPGEAVRLAEAAGPVDILIANAALPGAARLEHLSQQEAERVLDVNLKAPVLLAQALLPGMIERGRGHLVFISSTAAKAAAPGNPVYHATKFGLRGLAGALRIDLHANGIGVSCVMPGFIRDAGLFAQSGAKLPVGVGTRSPQDVADAVVRAIEKNIGEVDVASPMLRLGALLSRVAPDLAAALARRLGSDEIAATYEQALSAKR